MTPPRYDGKDATAAAQPPPSPREQDLRVEDAESLPPPLPLLLSTAPVWIQGRVEAGGDGGPLEGVGQQWRDHWKQCWVQVGGV